LNIKRFSSIPKIKEYSIGHSIIARAVMVGLDQAIREMITLMSQFSVRLLPARPPNLSRQAGSLALAQTWHARVEFYRLYP